MRLPLLLSGLLLLPLASAQRAGVAMPVLGYTYDSGLRVIRPIMGIPGAAVFGAPLGLGYEVAAAAISPRNDYALTISAEDGQVRVVQLRDTANVLPVPGGLESPDQIILSPTGHAALLSSIRTHRIQIVTGFGDSPQARDLDVGFAGPAVLAVSDNGDLLFTTEEAAGAATLLLWRADGNSVRLALPSSAMVAAFGRNSRDAVVVTETGDIYMVREEGTSLVYRQALAAGKPTARPVAVRLSPDRSHAYVANTDGILSNVDLQARAANTFSCGCTPSGLFPLNGASLFRLSDGARSPMLLLDGSRPDPRVWFVPRALPDSERSGQ